MKSNLHILVSFVGCTAALVGCGSAQDMPPDGSSSVDTAGLCGPANSARELQVLTTWSHRSGDSPDDPPLEDAAWVSSLPVNLIGTKALAFDISSRLASDSDAIVHDTDMNPVLRWTGSVASYQGQMGQFAITDQVTPIAKTPLAGLWKFIPENPQKIGIENYNKEAAFLIHFSCE